MTSGTRGDRRRAGCAVRPLPRGGAGIPAGTRGPPLPPAPSPPPPSGHQGPLSTAGCLKFVAYGSSRCAERGPACPKIRAPGRRRRAERGEAAAGRGEPNGGVPRRGAGNDLRDGPRRRMMAAVPKVAGNARGRTGGQGKGGTGAEV